MKNVIITDSVANANALLRQADIITGVTHSLMYTKTVYDMALELVIANRAANQQERLLPVADSDQLSLIMRQILQSASYNFLPKESYSEGTADEVLRIINVIRNYPESPAFQTSSEPKVAELKHLANRLEERLTEENLTDRTEVLKEAERILTDLQKEADAAAQVAFLLPWAKDATFQFLENSRLAGLEQSVLDALLKILGLQAEIIPFRPISEQGKVNYEFYKAYGMANEIGHIADLMREESIPAGNVEIIYSDAGYVGTILGVLEGRGIQVSVLSGRSLLDYDLARLLYDILDWAEQDYSYQVLENVAANRSLCYPKEAENHYSNIYQDYAKNIKWNIGWGLDRYQAVIALKESGESDDRRFATFLKVLTEAFVGVQDCVTFYQRLLKVIQQYSSGNEENNLIYKKLQEKKAYFANVEQGDLVSYIKVIKEKLKTMKNCDEEKVDSVSVTNLSNRHALERKYNFIVGLSAKQFAVSSVESPVLSDRELEQYWNDATLYRKNAGMIRRSLLDDTIASLHDGRIYMSYITKNTAELQDSSASLYLLQKMEAAGRKADDIPYVGYPTTEAEAVVVKKESIREQVPVEKGEEKLEENQQKEDKPKEDEKKEEKPKEDKKPRFSSSGLKTMMECPLHYYYQDEKYLPQMEFAARAGDQWLNPATAGNLFHYTLNHYCSRCIGAERQLPHEIQEAIFEECYETALEELLAKAPAPSRAIYQKEARENKPSVRAYITALHAQMNQEEAEGKAWRILPTELSFKELPYTDRNFTINLDGSIDRLDGYVDENGILQLRIIDYKTGKVDNKQKEIENNTQLQHFFYAMAALDYAKREQGQLETIFGRTIDGVAIEKIAYIFPYEDNTEIDMTQNVMGRAERDEAGNLTGMIHLPDAVLDTLEKTEGLRQQGDKDQAHQNEVKLSPHSDGACNHCKYKDLCQFFIQEKEEYDY